MKIRTKWVVYSVVLVALCLRFASETTANVSFILLAFIALFGLRESVQALALSWLFSMINPGLAPDPSLGAASRYLVVFSVFLSVFARYKPRFYEADQKRLILYTFALGLFFLFHSLLFSPLPLISVLKLISWTLTVTTLFAAWSGLDSVQREALMQQIFAGLTVVMLGSLPLIAMPLGYLRNGHGFQGILNHPQVFGPTMSLLGAWAAINILTLPRPPWNATVLAGVCLVLIVLSEARTAGFALVGGLASSLLVTSMLSRQKVTILFPGLRSLRVALVSTTTVFIMIAFAPQVSEQVNAYITKRSGEHDILDVYAKSRGGFIDRMWQNIERKPLTGIGFGIASIPATMKISRDPLLGLPVGAPVEKGVLPIAVMEEVGLPGLVFVLLWGCAIFRRGLRGGGAAVAVLATIVLLNLGEATFFSPGGMGLLSLVLLGWVATVGQRGSVIRYG